MLRRRLLLFAEQQRNTSSESTEQDNPSSILFDDTPVASLSAQGQASKLDYRQVSTSLTRVASCVIDTAGQLWSHFLNKVETMINKEGYTGLLFAKARRYDETPLKVRTDEGREDGAERSSRNAQVGLAAKIYQTEFGLCMLLHRPRDDSYVQLTGRVPTCLQVVESNAAETVLATQEAVEKVVDTMQQVSSHFQVRCCLPCTDGHASNTAAERMMSSKQPSWVKVHTYCSVHKTSSCTKYAMALVEPHISGVLALGVCTQFAGSARKRRQILMEVITSQLEIKIGPPQCEQERNRIYDLFLDCAISTGKSERRSGLQMNRQRLVLDHFLNGNVHKSGIVEHWVRDPQSKEAVLRDFQAYVIPALIPGPCPKLNRSNWLGHEASICWAGLLACHHNLLQPLMLRFCNYNLPVPRPVGEGERKGNAISSWSKAVEHASKASIIDGSQVVATSLVLVGADEPHEIPQEAQLSWAEINKANKKKASLYAASSPGATLMVMQLTVKPLQRLMTDLIFMSSKRWDQVQDERSVAGSKRSYRVLDMFRGTQIKRCFASIQDCFHQSQPHFPVSSMTSSTRCLMFRLLSRSGSAVRQLMADLYEGCPFKVFSALDGAEEAESLLKMQPCLRDSLATWFVKQFPSVEDMMSKASQVFLTSLARTIQTDIVGVESRHASNRRLVVMKSVQTWPLDFAKLSAEYVIRQQRISIKRFSARATEEKKVSPKHRKGKKKQKGRGGYGGPWRAFVHLAGRGRKVNKGKTNRRISGMYHEIKREQGEEWQKLVEWGNIAKLAGRKGLRAFPRQQRAAAVAIQHGYHQSAFWKVLTNATHQWKAEAASQREVIATQEETVWQHRSEHGKRWKDIVGANAAHTAHGVGPSLLSTGGSQFEANHLEVHLPAENLVQELLFKDPQI